MGESDAGPATGVRSCLAVPADRPDRVRTALESGADEVVVDLEDAVRPADKVDARAGLTELLPGLARPRRGCRLLVRVNAVGGPWLLDDVLALAGLPDVALDGLVVPKAESPADVHLVAGLVEHVRRRDGRDAVGGPVLGLLVESAAGLEAAAALARAHPRVEHLVLGPGDLAADLGMPSTTIGHDPVDEDVWHAARVRLLVAGRAAGVRVVDGPYGDHADDEGLSRSAGRAARLGYDAKWAVHPRQLPALHAAFGVDAEQVDDARALLQALDDAPAGAATHRGRLVDEASRRQAERRLARAAAHEVAAALPAAPEAARPSPRTAA